jgi:hypothetical protein
LLDIMGQKKKIGSRKINSYSPFMDVTWITLINEPSNYTNKIGAGLFGV